MEEIRSAPIKTACGEVRIDLDKPARGMSGKVTALHVLLNEMMIRDWKSNIFGLIPVFANDDSDGIKIFQIFSNRKILKFVIFCVLKVFQNHNRITVLSLVS